MALLSQMMRTAAITGRSDHVHAWFADRQGGRWADQLVRDAFPPPRRSRSREETERGLSDLHARGVLTDEELERLRARLGV
jgi:hypothetical protein